MNNQENSGRTNFVKIFVYFGLLLWTIAFVNWQFDFFLFSIFGYPLNKILFFLGSLSFAIGIIPRGVMYIIWLLAAYLFVRHGVTPYGLELSAISFKYWVLILGLLILGYKIGHSKVLAKNRKPTLKSNLVGTGLISLAIYFLFFYEGGDTIHDWEPLNVSNTGKIIIQGVVANESGVLLAFGYDKDSYDCGFLNLVKCRKFKTFRSFDKGETWEEITDDKISYLHAIQKGDKVTEELIEKLTSKFSDVLLFSKKVYDFAKYNQFRSKGKYMYDGDKFYIYIDFLLYVSEDNGESWTSIDIENNVILLEYGDHYLDIVDDYLVMHIIESRKQYLFKREGNEFKQQKHNKFAVIYRNNKKKLIFNDGKNLATNYSYDNKNKRIVKYGDNPDSIQYTTQFFLYKNRILSNTIVGIPQFLYAFYSDNGGKNFRRANFLIGHMDVHLLKGFKIIGMDNGVAYIKGTELKFLDKNSDNYWVGITPSYYYKVDYEKNRGEYYLTPTVRTSVFGMHITPEYVYFFNQMGLFRKESK